MNTRSFKNDRSSKFLFRSSKFKGRRSSGSFSRGGKKGGFGGERIDPARFINKAVMTEEVDIFKSEHKFQDFKIDQRLKQIVASRGYKMPTPIQDRIIPCAVNGSDVVGVANTGTGKTAAFLLPLINKIILNPKEQVLIVTPTRELALQIDQEFQEFTKGLRLFSVCCVGGMSIGRQISNLRYRYNVIIGTPGRLKDLIERKMITLSRFNSIVLDEADRMLDMGFINDTRFIMSGLPRERQVLLFSATIPYDIESLIREFLKDPVRVSVKTRDTANHVEQDIIRIERGKNKLDVLNELLSQIEFNKVLIFGRTKHGVERLSRTLSNNGFKVESIHGNKNNSQRQRALGLFKSSRVQVLVATDVAARGLDIADISHVINFDIPATYTDYVHRIGRTGRGNKRGMALTFIE
ncbi:MAG: DEAD/DEAH box helicase [Parcubacteria group bacterium]|nr:MAG: DEAD/DEAH box helicase [Parcubacteria group bacterium]